MTATKYEKVSRCNICGKEFVQSAAGGRISCVECSKNKWLALNRPFTKDTVFLVCKWYGEGLSVRKIAEILNRSEDNVIDALAKGGIDVGDRRGKSKRA